MMLSRVALRSAAFSPAVIRSLTKNNPALSALIVRHESNIRQIPLEKHIENWDKAHKIYFGPERDHVNFPHTKQPDAVPPVRLGFIPQSWFDFFYEKTGVTGPYMFGIGLSTFLLSKEIWVVEHNFTEFVAFWIAMYFLIRKTGPAMKAHFKKMGEDYRLKRWAEPVAAVKSQAESSIKEDELAIWQQEGQQLMYEAKRENVDLQLEAIYRQRFAEVHQAVKKRLDYQMDVENCKRNFEQKHMVDWIVGNVVKGITPQQEKDSITKCIADLKALSVKAA